MKPARKQILLERHRRDKRRLLAALLALGAALWCLAGWFWLPPFLFFVWLAHEIWLSDHQFYPARVDYRYTFDPRVERLPLAFADGQLRLAENVPLAEDDTLILALTLRTRGVQRLFDASVEIRAESVLLDCQGFERGACGQRYLNLTGFAQALTHGGLRLSGRHCRVAEPQLWRVAHPDYRQKRLLVIAPHADDAELAAFGLYANAR
ncbi:MAG: hypothetical protein LBB51_02775, partial [Zoogloeaceae bacterium]|nr:hypothetical protein [Zoogloeaceae bacterium]